MVRSSNLLIAYFFFLLTNTVIASTDSSCQQGVSFNENDTVYLEADKIEYSESKKTYLIEGNVRLLYKGRILKSDSVIYDANSQRATAHGHVKLIDKISDIYLDADHLELNKELSFGVADMLYARRGKYLKIAAEKVTHPNDDITEFHNIVYTPCSVQNGQEPLWQVRAQKVIDDTTTMDVTYKEPSLEILGQSVLNLPEFTYPRPTVQRRTGVLIPEVQFDSAYGLSLKTPYFIEFSQDKTLTTAPTFYTENMPLWENNYKQRTDRGVYNVDTAFTFANRNRSDGTIKEKEGFRGSILSSGRHRFDNQAGIGFDFNRVTDDTFFNRFDLAEYDYLQSRLFYNYDNDRTSLYAGGYNFQNLDPSIADATVPVILPYIDFNHVSSVKPWGGRLSYTSNIAALHREEGIDTRRFVNQLHWEKNYALPAGMIFTFENMLRGDLYNTSGGLDPSDNKNMIDKGTTARVFPLTAGKIALPLIKKQGEVTQLIEPTVQVVMSPYNNNASSIPNEDGYASEFDSVGLFDLQRFYGHDLIEDGPRLNTGVRYLVQKSNIGSFETDFGQSFRPKSDNRFPSYSGLGQKESDYVGRFVVNYRDTIHLTHRYRFNNLSDGLTMSDFGAMVGNEWFNTRVNYFQLEKYNNPSVYYSPEQLNFASRVSFNSRWHLIGGYRQNLPEHKTLESRIGMLYTDECFVSELSVGREFLRYKDIEPGTSIKLRVKLLSLGNNAFIEE